MNIRNIIRPNALPSAVLNVGLTGGMGSGKSTVARALQQAGAAIVDMDAFAHKITAAGGEAMNDIRDVFGADALNPDGSLNRAYMRELVFSNADAKNQLEHITHSIIDKQAISAAQMAALKNPLCIVYDIPLLVGNQKWLATLDFIIVVSCTHEQQIERVLKRNPILNRKTVERIIQAQASAGELDEIADALIDNSINEINCLHIYRQVNILIEKIEYLTQIKSKTI